MKSKKIIFIFISLIATVLIYKYTIADDINNVIKVEEDSYITYYLGVKYDGIDIYSDYFTDDLGIASKMESGYLIVEDRIPEYLEFQDFVVTYDGTIGANNCYGNVVDDTLESTTLNGVWNDDHTEYTYHGLHYNVNNKTVSFKVENLQVGCQLNIGIKVKVPSLKGKSRIDFYNYGLLRESANTVYSNLLHHYIGNDDTSLIPVKYEYTGTVPDNAPALPPTNYYAEGSKVGISLPVYLEGFRFNGWTSDDISIVDNSFNMPDSQVTIKGSFTPVSAHSVIYSIDGVKPKNYILPSTKEFYDDVSVKIDSGLKPGDVFNGYRFLGWTSDDVEFINGKSLIMPDHDVHLIGKFEEEKYKVTYVFTDSVIPSTYNNRDLVYYYKPGEIVKLLNITEPDNYKFLGWRYKDNFKMPSKDIKIYGSWKIKNLFSPVMSIIKVSEAKEYYKIGDLIEYKLRITNEKSYNVSYYFDTSLLLLRDEEIKYSDESSAEIVENDSSEIDIGSFSILNVAPGETIEIPVYNRISLQEFRNHKSTSYLTLKTAKRYNDNIYYNEIDFNNNYTFNEEINVPEFPSLDICLSDDSYVGNNIFIYDLFDDFDFETSIILNKNNKCSHISLYPGRYTVKQRGNKDYTISDVIGIVSYDGENFSSFSVSDNVPFDITNQKDIVIKYKNNYTAKPFLHVSGTD